MKKSLIRVFLSLVTRMAMVLVALTGITVAAENIPSSARSAEQPCCGPVTPAAQAILTVLDRSDVEHLWLNHHHVNWETGQPDKPDDYSGPGNHTHCSAFAAAMGARLGVYMLRPPQHSQILLASAQTRWFDSQEGRQAGWIRAADALHAQQLANQGMLVVISYESPDKHRPGHIVIVRPSSITLAKLRAEGPYITQAGTHNLLVGNAATAFAGHPGAWPNGVKFFAHALRQ
ncbi:hypothetical protein [Pantoea ananatis]|uniref:Uncharacterized protein n=3 Tax=Pantoea ananas TaxID=553 RepID=A0A8A4JXF0_PANAN|nr:hypothetical protein [Pantoea ananatis]MCH9270745.1 hypothetical protein [Pantoea ananatis]MCV3298663.1 hypothetical protein [Pantoea ananatis]MDQ1223957.1 hypothetical protein [Pantoea ananatis]MDR6092247.1 hypothetical protein [Pantoea ananatis]PWV63785.1 hypothetical protein C7425_107240 [Pantoea ananatis]